MTTNRAGRPRVGTRVEVRLTDDVLAAVEAEADEFGMKRAEMLRWIITERYEATP